MREEHKREGAGGREGRVGQLERKQGKGREEREGGLER
jgi:hypothetical protein